MDRQARLLAGTPHANALLAALTPLAQNLRPTLAIVQVGSDPASDAYVGRKITAAEEIGIATNHVRLSEQTSIEEMLSMLKGLNADAAVTGYIIQLPLPDHLWDAFDTLVDAIDPSKDVDGFTAINFGRMALRGGNEFLPPATAAGVIRLLEQEKIPLSGAHSVIIGRSNLVGKPLALMLLNRNATVTVCHSRTTHLPDITRTADILVSAVGTPGLVTADMVKEGAVVVDIGITRTDGKLVGDVEFSSVSQKASAITPVPGGVGPLTVACLLQNVVAAAQQRAAFSQ